MKINRSKLNTLLRSNLKPAIKTRKQLAAQLGLDPTSLTRWFAAHDRLGNPRYPVVPDRHVANILQIFELQPDCLDLDDEAFHQYCFALALQRHADDDQARQKARVRLEKIAQRTLTIPQRPGRSRYTTLAVLAGGTLMAGAVWYWLNPTAGLWQPSQSIKSEVDTAACWTGYSASLGHFPQTDEADPCHYGKLFHRAMVQLKADNDSPSAANKDLGAQADYILFLANQLQQRQARQAISLQIELGRLALRRLDHPAARSYFQSAQTQLADLPQPDPEQVKNLSTYLEALSAGEKRSKFPQPDR